MGHLEVIHKKTGCAMSRSIADGKQTMGTTLFDSEAEAMRWLMDQNVNPANYEIRPADESRERRVSRGEA